MRCCELENMERRAEEYHQDTEAPDPKSDEETPQKYLETEDIFDGWTQAEKLRGATSEMLAGSLQKTVKMFRIG